MSTIEYTQEDQMTDSMTIRWIETTPVDVWVELMLAGGGE